MVNMAVSCPHTFSLRSHNSQVLPLVTRGILPHILKSIHKILSTQFLVVWGSKKQHRRGQYHSNFTKRDTFLVSLKLSAILGNLTLHHSCLSLPKNTSFLQFGQEENIRGHLFEKIFLVCFSALSPQVEQKENDEHFANYLQMYGSRTFTEVKNSVIWAEYPMSMSSKFHLSKQKRYFSQFADEYLKIEEVEYLIH